MKTAGINSVVRDHLKTNKIKFGEVAKALGMSQSNFSERLRSSRSLSLDEFMVLYKMCKKFFMFRKRKKTNWDKKLKIGNQII